MTHPSRAELLAQLESLRSMILALPEEATVQPEAGTKVATIILREVSETFEVPVGLILDKSKSRWIVEARFAAMSLIHEFCRMSSKPIALFLKRRDHGCVLNGIKTMQSWCESDEKMRERMNGLRTRLRATLRT